MQLRGVVEVFFAGTRVMVTAAIGAVLGLKRRFNGFGAGAQLLQHGLEHVVIEQAQPAIAHLQGNVAVAQVIGGAGQFKGIAAGDVQQLFGAGADAHDASVLGLQKLAIDQRRLAAFKEQADVFAAAAETAQAAFAPCFEVQV